MSSTDDASMWAVPTAGCLAPEIASDLADGSLAASVALEARAHLATCDGCRRLVSVLAAASGLAAPSGASRSAPASARLGRFIVTGSLGAGAMGVVVAARDPELERPVALKLLAQLGSDDAGAERLRGEALSLARLSHPNVVTVYDVFVHELGLAIAMEHLSGGTLREWMATPRAAADVLAMFHGAGEGLAAAHAAGVVHRDFKPENVLLDAAGVPHVSDFGLARGFAGGVAAGPVLASSLAGTPAYMAPETLAGAPASPASDQFSFAAALYEALAGVRPFAGETTQALAEAARRGTLATPLPGRRLPRAVGRVLARALAATPEARYPDLAAMLAALRRAGGRPRRVLAAVVALGAVGGAVALGAVVASTQAPAGVPPTAVPTVACPDAARPIDTMWTEARRAQLAAAFASSGAPGGEVIWQKVGARIDGWRSAWIAASTQTCLAGPTLAPDIAAAQRECLHAQLGRLDAQLTLWAAADRDLVRGAPESLARLPSPARCAAIRSARGAASPLALPLRLVADNALALAESGAVTGRPELIGQLRAAASLFGEVELAAELAVADATLKRATAEPGAAVAEEEAFLAAESAAREDLRLAILLRQTSAAAKRGEVEEAKATLRRAEALYARMTADPSIEAGLHRVRGQIALQSGDFAGAEAELAKSREILVRAFGHTDLRSAEAAQELALALLYSGARAEALREASRAVELYETLLGPEHPLLGRALRDLSDVFVVGDNDERAEVLKRARAIFVAWSGEGSVQVAEVDGRLARTALTRWAFEEALAYSRAAQTVFAAKAPGRMVSAMLTELQALGAGGRVAEAWPRALELAARAETLPDGSAKADSFLVAAQTAGFLRRGGDVVRFAERAIAAAKPLGPADDRRYAAYQVLGLGEAFRGRFVQAEAALARALEADIPDMVLSVAETYGNLAEEQVRRGQFAAARRSYWRGVALAMTLGPDGLASVGVLSAAATEWQLFGKGTPRVPPAEVMQSNAVPQDE